MSRLYKSPKNNYSTIPESSQNDNNNLAETTTKKPITRKVKKGVSGFNSSKTTSDSAGITTSYRFGSGPGSKNSGSMS